MKDLNFKIKINGQKVKVRVMRPDEIIQAGNLTCVPYFPHIINTKTGTDAYNHFCSVHPAEQIHILNSVKWFLSNAVGDRVDEHARLYLEILSPAFKMG